MHQRPKIQLKRVREQNEKRLAYVQTLNKGLEQIPGIDPLYVYPKAEPAGWYSGVQARYRPEDLGGLPRAKYCEALRAEGVQVKEGADVPDRIGPSGHQPYHMLPLFARGFDLYTHGRGPLWEGYDGYDPEAFPQTRKALARMLTLPVLTDPEEGVGAVSNGVQEGGGESRRVALIRVQRMATLGPSPTIESGPLCFSEGQRLRSLLPSRHL